MTFIQHAGVLKWIRLSQFRFKNTQWQYFLYILCKFDQDWYSNSTEIVPRFDDRRSFITWCLEMDWNIMILISASQLAIISVHCVEIW